MNKENPERLFDNYPDIIALVSHRNHGNMKITAGFYAVEARKNRKEFIKFLPDKAKMVTAGIIHGTKIRVVKSASSPIIYGADALITSKRNIFLGVTFADCPPVFFADSLKGLIASAHCSYKNVSNNFPVRVLERMIKMGSRIGNIRAMIGPGICSNCYEFGEEDAEKYFAEYPSFILPSQAAGKCKLDLKGIIKDQLLSARLEHVEVANHCTCCGNGLYFSARREKMAPGCIKAGIALIGMPKTENFHF